MKNKIIPMAVALALPIAFVCGCTKEGSDNPTNNQSGTVLPEIVYDLNTDGSVYGETRYEYDGQKRVSKMSSYYDGELAGTETLDYTDTLVTLTAKDMFSGTTQKTYFRINDEGFVSRKWSDNSDMIRTYEYDSGGYMTTLTTRGYTTEIIRFVYDNNHTMVRYENEIQTPIDTSTYTYDVTFTGNVNPLQYEMSYTVDFDMISGSISNLHYGKGQKFLYQNKLGGYYYSGFEGQYPTVLYRTYGAGVADSSNAYYEKVKYGRY